MTSNIAVADAPSSKEEAWRYTPVKEIATRVQKAVTAKRSSAISVSKSELDSLAGKLDGIRLVFVNGFYNAELSDNNDLPAGLFCGLASDGHSRSQELVSKTADVRTIEGLHNPNDDYDIAVVIADDDLELNDPIHIIHIATNDNTETDTNTISHPRTIIDIGNNNDLDIVETYCGLGKDTIADSSTTIHIGDHSTLNQCRIQNESPSATHVGNTRITQGRNSHVKMASITIGSDIARNAIDVHLDSLDAKLELTGVNLTTDHQVHDTEVTVTHATSHCASNQRFVGVVNDHGHCTFSGEIIVEHGTVGTDAHQSNKNLVLDKNAKADTRPWLRIFADDVKCTHGATVGRLDDNALFYLRSRGIDLNQARTMLIHAFIQDITNSIDNESVRDHVDALVDATAAVRTGLVAKEIA